MDYSFAQWIGTRERQEDSGDVMQSGDGLVMIVCDGMGGHDAGDVASQTAVSAYLDMLGHASAGSIPELMELSLRHANEAVRERFANLKAHGGTTLLSTYFSGGVLWWISVGDSPLYLWRQSRLIRLNADHSLRSEMEQLFSRGQVSYQQLVRQSHYLRSALTGQEIDEIDVTRVPYPLLPGDKLLVSSDGIEAWLENVRLRAPQKLGQLFSLPTSRIAQCMIDEVMDFAEPNQDNTTVIVAEPF